MSTHSDIVSIVVIAYNSSNYIIDLLESIKGQTYQFIELIITDDCSTDNTTNLVNDWLMVNTDRFSQAKLITSTLNSGITKNLNRGLAWVTGNYVKPIAADDVLLPNSIEELVRFCKSNQIDYCFSQTIPFIDNEVEDDAQSILEKIRKADEKTYLKFFGLNEQSQFREILRLKVPFTIIIGGFYKFSVLKEIDFFDENYDMMEDYPFILKLAKLNICNSVNFYLLPEKTVKYRVRNTKQVSKFKFSPRYIRHFHNLMNYRKEVIIPEMLKEKMYFSIMILYLTMFLLNIEFKYSEKAIVKSLLSFLRKLKHGF